MHPLTIPENHAFIGRIAILEDLHQIGKSNEASMIIMYGRRRIGKTELLEQAFRERNILKFEGIEGLDKPAQLRHVMQQLAQYTGMSILAKTEVKNWVDFFECVASYTQSGKWTIYLEEIQWLANYNSQIISELKYVWDNYFRRNNHLVLIVCGSSPSFMIDQVIHSKALYNRSQFEFHLKGFNLIETKSFLQNKNTREVLDALLTVGGVPEYLKWLKKKSSVYLSLCDNAFKSNSFFSHEYKRIFTSSLASNKDYKNIVDALSKTRYLSRKQIQEKLSIKSGGTLSKLLTDLEKSGIINEYHPFYLTKNSRLKRYTIADHYLQFYFKFISPIEDKINNGDYNHNPSSAIKTDTYYKWLGFSFERWCRKNHRIFANILGFTNVQYNYGVYYSRSSDKEAPGFQIDLIYDRSDHVYTICEIKYLQSKVHTNVIDEFEKKLSLFKPKKEKTIHKVLICNQGADNALINYGYFDAIIDETFIFDKNYW